MKCKDITNILMDSPEVVMDPKKGEAVRNHIKDCRRCSHLKEDLENLRGLVEERPKHSLPRDLDRETYLICQSEMRAALEGTGFFRLQMAALPLSMKIVFSALLVLTGIWLFPLFKDFSFSGETFSIATIVGVFFIIQNAMMLLFAPLLIRRSRSKKIDKQFCA